MLQKLSNVKLRHDFVEIDHLNAFPILLKSNFGEFKRSTNVIFANLIGSENLNFDF